MAGDRKQCSPEALRVIERIRELLKLYPQAEVARMVGKSNTYVHYVRNGLRPRRGETFTMARLQLRYSSKMCRRCGEAAGIVTKSKLCIKCELRELDKSNVIKIAEEELEEEFALTG